MDNGRLRYIELFLDSVDSVEAGRKGSISDNKRLVSEYDPSYYSVLEPHLRNSNPRVRSEVIILLSKLKERKASERIREMRISDTDLVTSACIAYLNAIGSDDDAIPTLIDRLKHSSGAEFRNAAMRLKGIARDSDLPVLREIYGQVGEDLKPAMMDVLKSIIARYPELRPKRDLILSDPVYPNENKLKPFLDKSIVYMDIRYRDNYADETRLDMEMYNRIASAFKKIQIRLYNEKANLKYYSDETRGMYRDAEELLLWAIEDLSSKEVIGADNDDGNHHCPHCGGKMGKTIRGWICPECGHRS